MFQSLSSLWSAFTGTTGASSTPASTEDGHRVTYGRERSPVQFPWPKLNLDLRKCVLERFVQDALSRNDNDEVNTLRSLLPLRQVSRSFDQQLLAAVHCEPKLRLALIESMMSLDALLSGVRADKLDERLNFFFSQRTHVAISLPEIASNLRIPIVRALANCTHLKDPNEHAWHRQRMPLGAEGHRGQRRAEPVRARHQ